MPSRKVVITGLGVIAPNGIGVEKFWLNAMNGVSGLRSYEWGRRFGVKSSVIGQVTDFYPIQHDLSLRQIHGYGRYLQFALAAADMAVRDSALDLDVIDRTRFGVLISSAIADAASMEENLLRLNDNGRSEVDPAWAERGFYDNLDFGIASTSIACKYGAAGPVANLSTGCTAGLDALGFAFEQVRSGKADIMIAGASEAPLCPLSIGSFEALGALSTRQCEDHKQASTPYTAERDGFVIAEGCGVRTFCIDRQRVSGPPPWC